MSEIMEALQASVHGDWARRSGVPCPMPATEAGDDPCGPGQRAWLEGVSEALGPAVDRGGERMEHGHVFGPERRCCRPFVCTIAGMNELHAHDGSAQRNDGEL